MRLVLRDDAVRMRRAVLVDVVNRRFHAVHDPHIQDVIVVFGVKILLRCPADFGLRTSDFGLQNRLGIGVNAQLHVLLSQPLNNGG